MITSPRPSGKGGSGTRGTSVMTSVCNDPRLQRLAHRLAECPARRIADVPGLGRAAVALVVRPAPLDLEILLIKRATRAGDPWSGHVALPGGRCEACDADVRATAIRETREEVGLDLQRDGLPLGRLDEVQPLGAGVPPLVISPFVYAVAAGTPATPNAEVEAALWVEASQLSDPASRAEYLHPIGGGRTISFLAFSHRGHTIWGLTYRILSQFLHLAMPTEPTSR